MFVMRAIHFVEDLTIGDDCREDRRRFEVANDERVTTREPDVAEFARRTSR